jgi:hypothetical protein
MAGVCGVCGGGRSQQVCPLLPWTDPRIDPVITSSFAGDYTDKQSRSANRRQRRDAAVVATSGSAPHTMHTTGPYPEPAKANSSTA